MKFPSSDLCNEKCFASGLKKKTIFAETETFGLEHTTVTNSGISQNHVELHPCEDTRNEQLVIYQDYNLV